MVTPKRFDVYLIELNPTRGREMQKTRPCLIVSPDQMNVSRLDTYLIAPMTTSIKPNFPCRVLAHFNKKDCHIALDQLRVIDHDRLVKKLGSITKPEANETLRVLQLLFS